MIAGPGRAVVGLDWEGRPDALISPVIGITVQAPASRVIFPSME
jgi:hypothetical protein